MKSVTSNRTVGLLLPTVLVILSVCVLQGCASTGGPSKNQIIAEVITIPEGIEVTHRGRVIGKAPVELRLRRLDEAVELATTVEEPPIIERRIKILAPGHVQIQIQLGQTPTAMARALGLTRVVVFDYGALTTFDVDQYELKPELLPMLQQQAEVLDKHFGGLDVYVCGHTDSTGSGDHNDILSVNRAQAVADYLSTHGLTSERMEVLGFGADYPVADNANSAGRQLNRRTEIILPDS